MIQNLNTTHKNHYFKKNKAARYIGSFIARANYLEPHVVMESMELLNKFAASYINQYNDDMPNLDLHLVFYQVCQSMMYINCYKHNCLHPQFVAELSYNSAISSGLAPLKMCSQAIIDKFEKLCENKYHSVHLITERTNKMAVIYRVGKRTLDMIYPFDPNFMKRSSRYLTKFYLFWNFVPGFEESDDFEESSVYDEEGVVPMSISAEHPDWALNYYERN